MTETAADQPTTEKISFSDTVASLTGYEEIAIEERFGESIGNLMSSSFTKAGRALLFVTDVRTGKKAADAYKSAMQMRLGDVNGRFFDEDEDADEFDPDNPRTEQGKDDTPSD